MNFKHLGIRIINIEETLTFYQNILECRLISQLDIPNTKLYFLDSNGITIELIYKEDNKERFQGPIEHIAFSVSSLSEKMKILDENKIVYSTPRTVGNAKIMFFNGPNNEIFEFVEGDF